MPNPNFTVAGGSSPHYKRPSIWKRVVPWAVTIGVVGICAGCAGWLVLKKPGEVGITMYPERVTEQNWKLITLEMTFKEVEKILGPTSQGAVIGSRSVRVGKTEWVDGVDIRGVKKAEANLVLWENRSFGIETQIAVGFDKKTIPPNPDSKVVWKAFWKHTGDKLIYLTEGGNKIKSEGHETRFP